MTSDNPDSANRPDPEQDGVLGHEEKGLVIIRDPEASRWLTFREPREILCARRASDVVAVLQQIQHAVDSGCHAAGFIAYEAASGFDPSLTTHPGAGCLLWFGIYETVAVSSDLGEESSPSVPQVNWQPDVSRQTYTDRVTRIREEIAAGNTYQVNYSIRFRTRYDTDPLAAFVSLANHHEAPYAAYVDTGDRVIASHSPELFFRLNGQQVLCRPMKGTAARGLTADDDSLRKRALANSAKDRAENLMIVDMIRNDLGRVAVPGSISVTDLFSLETYDSVHQMTTTVRARTDASAVDILAALFPSASITGAPKVNTMRLIRDLEASPRGAYTGTVGYLGPGRTAQFNVAIRTLDISRTEKSAVYGAGGGIVWDSEADAEYAECLTKTRVVSVAHEPFELLETLGWTPGVGYALYRYHLQRLQSSADYFGFHLNLARVERELAEHVRGIAPTRRKVRLTLTRTGVTTIHSVPLPEGQPPGARLTVALVEDDPVHSGNRFLYHKTTNRTMYESRLARYPDCDDVILCNERGELTESTIANLVVVIDGEHVTPPVSCGLLAGTCRQAMLDEGRLKERTLRPSDLLNCDDAYLINSVRGKIEMLLKPVSQSRTR
ncbi:MAG: aminodeoxychorismate synthase component I [Proteobacteria bacterium]|nr:aminodeoxychorismate synthase component I [Pseudomonadota bacterium]